MLKLNLESGSMLCSASSALFRIRFLGLPPHPKLGRRWSGWLCTRSRTRFDNLQEGGDIPIKKSEVDLRRGEGIFGGEAPQLVRSEAGLRLGVRGLGATRCWCSLPEVEGLPLGMTRLLNTRGSGVREVILKRRPFISVVSVDGQVPLSSDNL